MNVAILSLFRNAERTGQVARFMAQAAAMRDDFVSRGDRVRVIAVWGDCVDRTEQALIDAALDHNMALTLVEHTHGGPEFGSTEAPARLVALSAVINAGLEAVRNQDDAVFYVESDLVWEPATVRGLLASLREGAADLIAPLVYAGTDGNGRPVFYDVFCYRKNGERFGPFHPYHGELDHGGALTPVDCVGSAFVMSGMVGRDCRIGNAQALMGLCADAWAKGYRVAVDAQMSVVHP